jgi:hypothetical protein
MGLASLPLAQSPVGDERLKWQPQQRLFKRSSLRRKIQTFLLAPEKMRAPPHVRGIICFW